MRQLPGVHGEALSRQHKLALEHVHLVASSSPYTPEPLLNALVAPSGSILRPEWVCDEVAISLQVTAFNCRYPACQGLLSSKRRCALPCSSPKGGPEAPAGGGLEARLNAHTPVHGARRNREARVGADAGAGELLRTWEVGGGRQGFTQ